MCLPVCHVSFTFCILWLRRYATSRKVAGSNPRCHRIFFNLLYTSSYTVALGLTESLIEMNSRNLPGGKIRPALKANNFTAICEQIV
jgi:hypothetical protein